MAGRMYLKTNLKIKPYIELMRLNKPVGTFLVLWPALWSLWLAAEGQPPGLVLIVFILGAFVMRSAGCVINDYADRKWDGDVERTAQRPLATGDLTAKNALVLFGLLGLLALGLVSFLNPFTIALSLVALLLAILYPFTKRFTHWPQLFLGAAFAWAIPMGFAAVLNEVPNQAWWLFVTALIWTLIYDTMYAMADRPDDLAAGIKSTAVLFGRYDRLILAGLQILMLGLLVVIGLLFNLIWPYYLSLVLVAIMFIYHQWLIKDCDRQKCFYAFKHNHWAGLVILIGIIVSLQ